MNIVVSKVSTCMAGVAGKFATWQTDLFSGVCSAKGVTIHMNEKKAASIYAFEYERSLKEEEHDYKVTLQEESIDNLLAALNGVVDEKLKYKLTTKEEINEIILKSALMQC